MNKYDVKITLRPCKKDFGRGSRTFHIEFEAESKDEAENFGKQYMEGFLKDEVVVETTATLVR